MTIRWRPVTSARVLVGCLALGVLASMLLAELGFVEIAGLRPTYVLVACLAIALTLGVLGAATAVLGFGVALIATYLIVMYTPVIEGPAGRWVRNDAPAGRLDAVVVLSGYVNADSGLEAVAIDRLLTGMELVKAGVGQRLITTRVVRYIGGTRVTGDAGQKRLIALAGLGGAWTEVDSVGNTHDEATRAAALLLPSGATNVAVVTSPMHTRRACATFEAIGFRVQCVASTESKRMTWHPSNGGDRLAAFRDYAYERLGMVKYSHKGWIK